jgi:hypothetical protein
MAGLLGLILGRGEKDSWKKHGVEDVHGPHRPKRDENTKKDMNIGTKNSFRGSVSGVMMPIGRGPTWT